MSKSSVRCHSFCWLPMNPKANSAPQSFSGWDAHSDSPGLGGTTLVASRALFCSRAPTALVTVGSFLGLICILPYRERGNSSITSGSTQEWSCFHLTSSRSESSPGTYCTQGKGTCTPCIGNLVPVLSGIWSLHSIVRPLWELWYVNPATLIAQWHKKSLNVNKDSYGTF